MTTAIERQKPTPFPSSATMSINKGVTRSHPKYKPKETRLGKPRSIAEILASPPPIKKKRDGVPTSTTKKPASGRSLIMESLKGFDDDDNDDNFSLPSSSKAKGSSASVGGKPKKKSNSFTGGRIKPPPIREDDESVTSVRSMPVGTKSSPRKKSKSLTGSRPTPRTISENTELQNSDAKKSTGPKRGRKSEILANSDAGESKPTRSSSLGAVKGARERVAKKADNNKIDNNNDDSSVQSFTVKKPQSMRRKPNYKAEKLDKKTAFSVSLDGASTHSSRSMGIPVRRRGGTNNGNSGTTRGRSRNIDDSIKKQVRSSSLGALQGRKKSSTSEKENQPLKLELDDAETKPVKKQVDEKTEEDVGTEANYKEYEEDLPLKLPSDDKKSKHSSSGRGKMKNSDGDDSEGSWGESSAYSTKSLGRLRRKKTKKEDDSSLGGGSLHSTKSVGRVGRRRERDNRIRERPSSLGPLEESRTKKKSTNDVEDGTPINATKPETETKKVVRSSSIGRLFGFGRKKPAEDSNEKGDNVATSQAPQDGSSKGTKLAKAKSGTERKRSSSLGPLDRGRRRSNSNADRDEEDLATSQSPKKGPKANKDISMDGSSHTMKSSKSGRATKRSSSLGPLNRGRRRRNSNADSDKEDSTSFHSPQQGPKANKDMSMDGSSHTMKSAKSGRARKRSSSVGPLGNVERNSKDASMDSSSHTMKSARGRSRKKSSRKPTGPTELSSIDNGSADATPLKKEGSSSNPPKTSIDLHTSTDTFESVLTEDTFLEEGTSPPANSEEGAVPSSEQDSSVKATTPTTDGTGTTENSTPEDEMKAKIAEMTSVYFEKKKKASKVEEPNAENDPSHDGAVGDDESTSAHHLFVSPRAGQNGLKNRNIESKLSTGEPTGEDSTESGPTVTDSPGSMQADDDVMSLRMEVVKKKEELLAAERAIFERERVVAIDERMQSLRKQEEMFATERAAFEMEKKMFTKERQAAEDGRLVKILELEELLAMERARFQKEKESLTQEQRDALEKERADLQNEVDKFKSESDSFLQENRSLAEQLEDAKQRNEDFKRVLNILSKQLEKTGSVQAQTDDHLLQVAGLTNANDEVVCDDEMFFEEDEEQG